MTEISPEIFSFKQKVEKFLENVPEGTRRVYWPKDLKREAVEVIQSGVKMTMLASVTGISLHNLSRWIRKKGSAKSNGFFRQVKIKEENPLKVISKKGSEIQGLSFAELQILFERKFL